MNRRGPVTVRRPSPRRPRRWQRGFTLIEVLVTTAVTVVAFTGLASLQVMALRSAGSALDRARATELAYEMIDRMRLNRGALGQAQTALGGGYDDITLCDASNRSADDARQCTHDGVADLNNPGNVTTDIRQWWQAIDAAELTSWYAGIQRSNNVFLVAVQWDDAHATGDADAGTTRESCLGNDMPGTMEEICVMTQL